MLITQAPPTAFRLASKKGKDNIYPFICDSIFIQFFLYVGAAVTPQKRRMKERKMRMKERKRRMKERKRRKHARWM